MCVKNFQDFSPRCLFFWVFFRFVDICLLIGTAVGWDLEWE